MARLIRTEKEVEGRFEEVWLVVEEDALEQWPAGERAVVGRPATRVDGPGRARGEALFTGDIRLPGLLQAAVLRSPFARAGVKRIDLTAARAAPGVRGVIGPGDCSVLTAACEYQGAAVAAICAETLAAGAGGARADRGRVGGARAAARSRHGRRDRLPARSARARARRPRARARRGRRRRPRDLPHPGRPPQLARDPPVGLPLDRRHARGAHLDPVHLGCPLGARGGARARPRPGPRRLRVHGRRLRLEDGPRRPRLHRRRARPPERPAGPLRALARRGEPRRRQPQRDDPAARRRRPLRRHPDRARRRVRQRGRLVRLELDDRGADAGPLCLPERPHGHERGAGSTCRR